MSPTLLAMEKILTLLIEAPSQIAECTVGLTEAQLRAAPGPGEWSVNEVLAHLRSCADVWGNCIAAIINQDKPTIRAVNPRTWINNTNYLELDFQPSFQTYSAQRADLLKLLQSIKPKTWSHAATVTGAGKVLERTVHTYADSIAVHERPHLKQIKRIANTIRK
jgi:hypothetical protein